MIFLIKDNNIINIKYVNIKYNDIKIIISSLFSAFIYLIFTDPAGAQEIWIAPPYNITQRSQDFDDFVAAPQTWVTVAKRAKVFSVPINYLIYSPTDVAEKFLEKIRLSGLKLDVSISALPVDKHICGDGLEGMIWPGEERIYTKRLKDELHANVDYFSFDLPLTSGHISKQKNACELSIPEVAQHLAVTVRELRSAFPDAKMVDSEVPTGMPVAEWLKVLPEWLSEFKRATGENLFGLSMDVWWKFNWKEVVKDSSNILHTHHVRSGVFVDSSEGSIVSPAQWIIDAKRNSCDLEKTKSHIDYLIAANWLNMNVKNLPENSPETLTYLANWLAKPSRCNR